MEKIDRSIIDPYGGEEIWDDELDVSPKKMIVTIRKLLSYDVIGDDWFIEPRFEK